MTKVSADGDARVGLIGHILSVFVVVDVAVHSTSVQNRKHGQGGYRKDDRCHEHYPAVLANSVRELAERKKRRDMQEEADHSDHTSMRDNWDLDAYERQKVGAVSNMSAPSVFCVSMKESSSSESIKRQNRIHKSQSKDNIGYTRANQKGFEV